MARSRSYQDDLLKALQDPEEARAYLNAANQIKSLYIMGYTLTNVMFQPIHIIRIDERTNNLFILAGHQENIEIELETLTSEKKISLIRQRLQEKFGV